MLWAFLRTLWQNKFRPRSESSFELPIQLDTFGTVVGGSESTEHVRSTGMHPEEMRILQQSSCKDDLCVLSSRFHIILSLYPNTCHLA